VKNIMPSKKVVLFIVEGITDEISIGHIVTKLKSSRKVYFQIVNSDITSDNTSNNTNIIKKLNEQVKLSMLEQHFKKSDIIKIVHLVDLDGAFANEDCIQYKNIKGVEYTEEGIFTRNKEKIKKRNLKKANILNKLSNTTEINKIPYEIYFFSTNLEHVLHNIQNAKDSEKQALAEKFEDMFYDRPEEFIAFIHSAPYALENEYNKTWQFIKADNHSLRRFTNFNLFFDKDVSS